ncbi:hypothetical protein GJ744_008131 [Endocarpon pusillum]|uniref:Uncharacterized protein n=1 Tax=Endocarpon pusillum TaxID=364733 RepID=A0A8H7AHZ3_9EURO|nr:hypothetical protein GJ744_008131 [Endocarpon pusillum]
MTVSSSSGFPPYLLSHAFWRYLEQTNQDLWRAAAGFMRTYAYLVQYEIDFQKAQSTDFQLIPGSDGVHAITFERFAEFIAPFAQLRDSEVNPRYQYGELLLTRLDFLAPLLCHKWIFHHVNVQWILILAKFFAWCLAAFVGMTTVLTAMQVELAVQNLPPEHDEWRFFLQASRWVSILVLILVVLICVVFIGVWVFLLVHDAWFAKSVI